MKKDYVGQPNSHHRGRIDGLSANCQQNLKISEKHEVPEITQGPIFLPKTGGGSGIRTHDTVAHIAVFKTAAFVRSAIPPVDLFDKIISL